QKEEQLLFFDRTTEGAAHLVQRERRTRRTRPVREKVIGVEVVIADELEEAAVILVTARSADYADHADSSAAEFWRHGIGDDFELLGRVHGQVGNGAGRVAQLIVRNTI